MLTKKIGATLAVAMCCAWTSAQAEVDEIVITANPLNGDKVAVPVSQLDQDQLDSQGGGSLGEALANELGITQSGFATGASRPIIRGLDNFRVRIQENGVAAHGVSALSEDHGAPADPLSADRVEVLRGPAVLRYGSQAIGGVVTILNDRIPNQRFDDGIEGEFYGALSSVDNGRTGALSLNAGADNLSFHADGFIRRLKDFELPDQSGRLLDTYLENEGGSVGASIIGENGHLGISVGRETSEYGIPAAEERLFIDMEQDKIRVAGSHNNLSFEGGWSDYQHDEVEKVTGISGSTFNNEEWEGRAEYLFTLSNGADAAVGVQASGRDLSALGEGGHLLSPVDSNAFAAFGFIEMPVRDGVTFQGGARAEFVSHDGFGVRPSRFDGVNAGAADLDQFEDAEDHIGGEEQDFNLTSGSVALLFTPDDARTFSFGVSYAERAPAPSELFSKGAHEATETFEIGDPDLSEERAISAEAKFNLDRTDRQVAVNLFYTHFDDFIYKAFTGFVCGEEFDECGNAGDAGVVDELTQLAFAQQDARFYGVEASLTQWLGEVHGMQIGFEGQFDMVRGRLDDDGNVPRVTPMRLRGGLIAEGDQVSAGVSLAHTFKQNKVGENEDRTKGFNNVSAQILYRPMSVENLTIGLVGQNLTDDVGRNHVSFKKADVVLPGRNFRVFVRKGF